MKDITGLGDPLKKLIEVIAQGVGTLYKPYLIRKTAEAKAYELKVIAQTIRENQDGLQKVNYEDTKLSIQSLDVSQIQEKPTLEERTEQRMAHREQKRQKNIENITQKAVEHLEMESTVSTEQVEEDWITRFFRYAEDISNEEMQDLWSRVLAGEVKQPKSFSMRTLEALRNLSQEEAQVFKKFASIALNHPDMTFITKEFQQEDDIILQDRLLMQELGFLSSALIHYNITETMGEPQSTFLLIGDTLLQIDIAPHQAEQRIPGFSFTRIGQELLNLVQNTPKLEYLSFLAKLLNIEKGHLHYAKILEKLPNGDIRHEALKEVPLGS